MLFSMHGDGPRLGEARADAVGAFMTLIPERPQRQSGVSELTLQRRVGDGAQHRALRIGENDRKAGTGDLLIQTLHLGACDGKQLAQALLELFHGLRVEHAIWRGAEGSMPYSRRHRCHDRVTSGSIPAGCKPLSTT